MHIKRYTVAALLLILLVGWYVYAFVSHEVMTLDFFGITFPVMPIAFWVVLPLLLLFLATLLHLSYYGAVGSWAARRSVKEYQKLLQAVRDALLGKKNRHHEYKTQSYAVIGHLLDHCEVTPGASLEGSDDADIAAALGLIRDIDAGKSVDIKKFHLDNDNPLVLKNHCNRYRRGEVTPEDVLSKPERFHKELADEAYRDFVKTAPLVGVVKYKKYMSRGAIENILRRINADQAPLSIDNETLIDLIHQIDVSEDDYLCGSIVLAQRMLPQQRMKLFEQLSERREEAMAAYIYTLYDLGVVEEANNLLDGARHDEFLQFRAYRALKEANKNYSINLFTPKVCR